MIYFYKIIIYSFFMLFVVSREAYAAYYPLSGGQNVGIGNSAPAVLLHVGSGGTPGVAAAGDVYIQNDLEVDGNLYGNGSGITNAGSWVDSGAVVRTNIASDNVGIGTTAPEQLLEVEGAEGANADLFLDADDGDDAVDTFVIRSSASDNQLQFLSSAATIKMNITSTGNVGIGSTTSPLAKVHVVGGTINLQNNRSYAIQDNTGVATNAVSVDTSNNVILKTPAASGSIQLRQNTASSSDIYQFFANSLEISRLTDTGSFGVLTTAPAELLDVVGEFEFDIDTANDTTIGVCKNTADGTSADTEFRECTGVTGDIAEWYETRTGVKAGDIVYLTERIFQYDEELFDPRTGLPLYKQEAIPNAKGDYQDDDRLMAKRQFSILQKATQETLDRTVGIVSTSPFLSFGKGVFAGKNPQPIALIGRVPTNVSLENGAIEAGDLITVSSVAGIGMKAIHSGRVVGYALEPLNGFSEKTVGQIMVFVNPHWWGGETSNSKEVQFSSSYVDYFKAAEKCVPYQLVSINEFKKIKPAKKGDLVVLGITKERKFNKADQYSVVLNGHTKAMVKGQIEFGDRLTVSSTPGYFKKAEAGETFLATAMESGRDVIEVMF